MKIDDRNIGPLRPNRPPAENREKETPSKGPARILPEPKLDRVELSPAARELAKKALHQLKGKAETSQGNREVVKNAIKALPSDTKDRLQQVRQRVLSGAYDIDHVVSEVARRILDRGDV